MGSRRYNLKNNVVCLDVWGGKVLLLEYACILSK